MVCSVGVAFNKAALNRAESGAVSPRSGSGNNFALKHKNANPYEQSNKKIIIFPSIRKRSTALDADSTGLIAVYSGSQRHRGDGDASPASSIRPSAFIVQLDAALNKVLRRKHERAVLSA
jgi:hypothetical protein